MSTELDTTTPDPETILCDKCERLQGRIDFIRGQMIGRIAEHADIHMDRNEGIGELSRVLFQTLADKSETIFALLKQRDDAEAKLAAMTEQADGLQRALTAASMQIIDAFAEGRELTEDYDRPIPWAVSKARQNHVALMERIAK